MFVLQTQVAEAILRYLGTRPYQEVAGLIEALRAGSSLSPEQAARLQEAPAKTQPDA